MQNYIITLYFYNHNHNLLLIIKTSLYFLKIPVNSHSDVISMTALDVVMENKNKEQR